MMDSVYVGDGYCANCSCSLQNIKSCHKIYKIDILVNVSKENDGILSCEQVSVITALRDLFNIQLYDQCFNLDSGSSDRQWGDIPVCLTCSLILQDLYKSFRLFKSVRKESSFVSQVTEKLQQIYKSNDEDVEDETYQDRNQKDPLTLSELESSQTYQASVSAGDNNDDEIENIDSDILEESNPTLTIFKTEELIDLDAEGDVDVNMRLNEEFNNSSINDDEGEEEDIEFNQKSKSGETEMSVGENNHSFEPGASTVVDNKDFIIGIDSNSKKKTITSKKGKICWIVKETFTDEETAKNFMLPDWKINHTFRKSSTEKQINYYCAKHKIYRCNAKAKLFFKTPLPGSNDSVEIKYCEAKGFKHTDRFEGPQILSKGSVLSKEQKDLIRELIQQGLTDVNEIIGIVQETILCPEPPPKKNTIQTFIRRQKQKMTDQSSQSISSLKNSSQRQRDRAVSSKRSDS